MGKLIFIMSLLLLSILMVNVVSAKEIWTFNNFKNNYKVYKSATCDVQGKKSCPEELGWQGDKIKFIFKLKEPTADTLKFNLYVSYRITSKPINIYVNDHIIVKKFVVRDSGMYTFEFSKSLLKNSKTNEIKIEMKDIKVGYGMPSQGFVIGSVSLEDVLSFCQSHPYYSSPTPIANQACCYNGNIVNSNAIVVGDSYNRFLCYNGQMYLHDGDVSSWWPNVIRIQISCNNVGGYYANPNYPWSATQQEWQGGWKSGNSEGIICGNGKVCNNGVCS